MHGSCVSTKLKSIKSMFQFCFISFKGAALILEPTSNINEMSTMVRELCVSLNSTMLQRDVAINIFFDDYRSSYANSGKCY